MTIMECFICAVKIGRGNAVSNIEDRVDKLISVSQTVEHSSTIISDILSRILNETVMKQETICRICFNLLNDIDYHLKEAQEKTDEITNKFLDKEKDPHSYKPHPMIVCANVDPPPSRSSQHSVEASSQGMKVDQRRKRRGKSRLKSSVEGRRLKEWENPLALTEDEMSVNVIDKSKAKLFSHILKTRTAKVDDDDDELKRKQSRKRQRKMVEHTKRTKSSGIELTSSSSSSTDGDSELELRRRRKRRSVERNKKKTQRPTAETRCSDAASSSSAAMKKKSGSGSQELVTVNMDELGDLFSSGGKMFYATKSEPVAATTTGAAAAAVANANVRGEENKDECCVCDICFKKFKRKLNLQLHLEKVHGHHPVVLDVPPDQIPETHRCSHCPREFTNAASLNAHQCEHKQSVVLRNANTGNGRKTLLSPPPRKPRLAASSSSKAPKAKCEQCNQTFQRLFNLKTHINRVHNKIKDHKCTECPKAFATTSDLKQHMVIHGQGKTFQCEICDRSFTNRDSIIFHRKQHTRQHTHFCPVCNKGFYKKSCVNRHMRCHTAQKPFPCQTCDKEFSQSSTLKIHSQKCSGSRAANLQ